MECFDNIIGLRGSCENPTSKSGLWINEIGVSEEEIDSIITKDFKDAYDFFEKKKSFAIIQIVNNLHSHFSGKYKANSIIKSGRIGFAKKNVESIAGEALLKGIHVEVCNDNSFVDFYLSSLSLQIDTSETDLDVFVYDLYQNKLIDTLKITTVANEITTIYPHKSYKSLRSELDLIFVYDATDKNSVKTSIMEKGCNSCSGGSSMTNLNNYVSARSIKIGLLEQKVYENLDSNSETGGMSMTYSINCNHEQWVCNIANSLALPILFKTAYEIMDFGYNNSQRLNTTTTIDFEKLLSRRDEYESRYQKSMENIIQNIKLPNDEKCFECRQVTKNVIILP